jgi:ParB family chromosome partitioning protein
LKGVAGGKDKKASGKIEKIKKRRQLMQQQKLGRGLDAIFGNRQLSGAGEAVLSIPLSKIKPNKYQPRENFNEEHIQELAQSIKKYGLIQPISVSPAAIPGEYELIAGERRYRASLAAGLTDIKAVVLSGANDENKMNLALIENLQRENLNPIEEAKAYQRLIDEFKHTHDEISEIVGKSRSTVTNSLRLLALPDYIQTFIYDGKISVSHGKALLGITDEAILKDLAAKIVDEKISVREIEQLASKTKTDTGPQEQKPPQKPLAVELSNLKDEIQRKFGTKVNIKGNVKKGKIEVFYYSLEDLERIAAALNINPAQ